MKNIVGVAPAPGGNGYWLVGSDGGTFAFGSAPYEGSLPGVGVHVSNVVGIAPNGNGYWLVGSDGGIFAFGSATTKGRSPGTASTSRTSWASRPARRGLSSAPRRLM